MQMEENRKFGMALSENMIQREVLQTTISFTDHQVYSPGTSEEEARLALKCCIFHGILDHIRDRLIEAKTRHIEHKQELSMLRNRLRRVEQQGAIEKERLDLQTQIESLEDSLINAAQRPPTLDDLLSFASDALRNTKQFVSASYQRVRLTHMCVVVDQDSKEPAYDIDLVNIKIANNVPRVAALVRFRRNELLPEKNFLQETNSLFPMYN
jgi:hypothetical protein